MNCLYSYDSVELNKGLMSLLSLISPFSFTRKNRYVVDPLCHYNPKLSEITTISWPYKSLYRHYLVQENYPAFYSTTISWPKVKILGISWHKVARGLRINYPKCAAHSDLAARALGIFLFGSPLTIYKHKLTIKDYKHKVTIEDHLCL